MHPELIKPNDVLKVAIDSWAGRTLHLVRVIKVRDAHVVVEWLDKSVGRFRQGRRYRPPASALFPSDRG